MGGKLELIEAIAGAVRSEEAQMVILGDSSFAVLVKLAQNRYLCKTTWMRIMSMELDRIPNSAMAEHRGLDDERITFLLNDPRPKVRDWLFQFGMGNVSKELGVKIVADGVTTPELAVAWFKGWEDRFFIPEHMIAPVALAAGGEYLVISVAKFPKLFPAEVLEKIAAENNPEQGAMKWDVQYGFTRDVISKTPVLDFKGEDRSALSRCQVPHSELKYAGYGTVARAVDEALAGSGEAGWRLLPSMAAGWGASVAELIAAVLTTLKV